MGQLAQLEAVIRENARALAELRALAARLRQEHANSNRLARERLMKGGLAFSSDGVPASPSPAGDGHATVHRSKAE